FAGKHEGTIVFPRSLEGARASSLWRNAMSGARARTSHAVAIAAAGVVWLASTAGDPARGQTRDGTSRDTAAGSIALRVRGGIVPADPARAASTQDSAAGSLEFSARAGFATDYIYRGVTLSDRRPAVGAGLEAALGAFYAGATVASVRLPTQPAAELTF